MRSRHLIAFGLVLVVGLGVTLSLLSGPSAEANVDAFKTSGINVSKMHVDAKLPIANIHDMTFVFSRAD